MQIKKRRKKIIPLRDEVQPQIWLPSAYHFGTILESKRINYAIFGAGALAVHGVMMRPTVDIDFVVNGYEDTISLMKEQPNIDHTNLEKEKDGIPVADFYFKSGVTIQIWDNNLYSLPMNDDSWSRVMLKPVPGYGQIRTISMEDLIVSKIGRYTQQRTENMYEANKNVIDIVTTMQALSNPDFNYVIQRLKEGARREEVRHSSRTHSLNWYFVREVENYRNAAGSSNYDEIGTFVAKVLVTSKSEKIEYKLLHSLRNIGGLSKFQSRFMLDDKSLGILLKRWKSILKIADDKVNLSARGIQDYIKTLEPEEQSVYAKQIIFSGKHTLLKEPYT